MSIVKKRLSPEESRSAALEAARHILIEMGPAALPKWWSRLAWVRSIRAATAFSVTAAGPISTNIWRAASSAADRLSSGLKRFFTIDMLVSKPYYWPRLPFSTV